MNGKGKGPEKGRDLRRFRERYDAINWRRPLAPPTQPHVDLKKEQSRLQCRQPVP